MGTARDRAASVEDSYRGDCGAFGSIQDDLNDQQDAADEERVVRGVYRDLSSVVH